MEEDEGDFFDLYFSFIGQSEAPKTFHRWTALSCIGALLARNVSIPFGHGEIYPNMYTLLMGNPGTRKSTAIDTGKKILTRIGYEKFSANKTSKEAMLKGMRIEAEEEELEDLMLNIPSELFIMVGEFIDFIGLKNDDFVNALTNLWDCLPHYDLDSVRGAKGLINKPTLSILGGSVPAQLIRGFGNESINGGFFSRMLFIHAEPTGRKIFPPYTPTREATDVIDVRFKKISKLHGSIRLTSDVERLLKRMYEDYPGLDDHRFSYYNTRRFTHLLKLITIITCANLRLEPTERDCILANTLLHAAEAKMPLALGEMGKARNSEQTGTIIEILKETGVPVPFGVLWKKMRHDLSRQQELHNLLSTMGQADKIQYVEDMGYLPKMEEPKKWNNGLVNSTLLDAEESFHVTTPAT